MDAMPAAARPQPMPLRTPAQQRALEHVLAVGEVGGAVRALPGGDGSRRTLAFVDPATGERAEGIVKAVAGGGAHDVFAYEVARSLGWEDMFAATSRRANGDAGIEYVAGRTWRGHGLRDAGQVEQAIARGYEQHRGLGSSDASHAAKLYLNRMGAYDIGVFNRDRKGSNAILDAGLGRNALYDHGMMASFGKELPVLNFPDLMRMDGTRVVGRSGSRDVVELRLMPETLAGVAGMDRDHVRGAFAQLEQDVVGHARLGKHATRPDETWLPRIFGMFDEALKTGAMRFLARW